MGAPDDELETQFLKKSTVGDTVPGLNPKFRAMPNDLPVQRALEVLFRQGKIHHTEHNHPMNIEDCWVCGINRSVCMDTECPGDYRLLVEAGFYG